MKVEALAQALGRPTLPAFRRLMGRLWLAADDSGSLARSAMLRVMDGYAERIQPNEFVAVLLATGIVVERARESYQIIGERATIFESAILIEDAEAGADIQDTWAPVATIPEANGGVPSRVLQTASVVFALMDEAKRELWLVTPYLDPPSVKFLRGPIAAAIARGAIVKMLTAERNVGFVDSLLASIAYENGQLSVWIADDAITELGTHAKAVVADRTRGYLGSANLTSYGMAKHFEIGARLEGPSVATLVFLFEHLASSGRPYVRGERADAAE